VTIDGKLDESAWKGAARTLLGGTRGGPGPKVGQTWFKVLYDDKNIYFALHAKDPDAWGSLQTRDSETWTEEVLEIFIDPDGDAKDYVELQITPMNVIFDARFPAKLGKGKGSREEQINAAKSWNSKLVSAVSIDGTLNNPSDVDKSWTAEISIPIADLPGPPPKAGTSWKLNVYRFDKARDKEGKPGTAQTAWAWAQPRGSFHNVERFGSLRFLNAKGIKPTNSVLDPKGLRKLPEKPKPSTKVGRPTGEVEPDKPE
jgi:hypothetical protein